MVVAYLCVGVAGAVVVELVTRASFRGRPRAYAGALAMALLAGNLAAVLLPLAEDNATEYSRTVGSNPFLTPDVAAVRAWIEENVEPGSDVVVPDRYAFVLYTETDGAYRFWDLPLAKLRYDADSPRLLRVLDERYPPVYREIVEDMGEEPWLYLRAKPQTELYKGFTEEALRRVLNASGAGVAILMDDEFLQIFLGYPGMHWTEEIGSAYVFEFEPGSVGESPRAPLVADEQTLQKLANDAGYPTPDIFRQADILTPYWR
jgi:hypothetical protein